MGKMNGSGDHAGHDMGKMGGEGGDHDMSKMGGAGMIGVHAKATASDIEGGSRLVLTVAPSDVGKIQSELRSHVQHMAGGSCAMGSH